MELPKDHKKYTICNWKRRGVIYHDFDELYEVYIKTMNCQHCGKEFPNKNDRCLDHEHETGMFRKILCRGCNNHDRYINHPNGYDPNLKFKKYRDKNKEKINAKRNENKETLNKKASEKITCECGSTIRRGHKSEHNRTMKHMDWWINSLD